MATSIFEQQFLLSQELVSLNQKLLQYKNDPENHTISRVKYHFLQVVDDIVTSLTCPIECFELAATILQQFLELAGSNINLDLKIEELRQRPTISVFYSVFSSYHGLCCPLSQQFMVEPVSTLSSKTFNKDSLLKLPLEERLTNAPFGVMYKNEIAQHVIEDWDKEAAHRISHKKNLIYKCIQYLGIDHSDDLLLGINEELLNLRKYMVCDNLSVVKYRPKLSDLEFVKKPILVSSGETFEEDAINELLEEFDIDLTDKGFRISNQFLIHLWEGYASLVKQLSRRNFVLEKIALYSQFVEVPFLRNWTLKKVWQFFNSGEVGYLVRKNLDKVNPFISFVLQGENVENQLVIVLEILACLFAVEGVSASFQNVLHLLVTILSSPFNSGEFHACVKLLEILFAKEDLFSDVNYTAILDLLVGPLSFLWRREECWEWEELLSVSLSFCARNCTVNIICTEIFSHFVDHFRSVNTVEVLRQDPVFLTVMRFKENLNVAKWLCFLSPEAVEASRTSARLLCLFAE